MMASMSPDNIPSSSVPSRNFNQSLHPITNAPMLFPHPPRPGQTLSLFCTSMISQQVAPPIQRSGGLHIGSVPGRGGKAMGNSTSPWVGLVSIDDEHKYSISRVVHKHLSTRLLPGEQNLWNSSSSLYPPVTSTNHSYCCHHISNQYLISSFLLTILSGLLFYALSDGKPGRERCNLCIWVTPTPISHRPLSLICLLLNHRFFLARLQQNVPSFFRWSSFWCLVSLYILNPCIIKKHSVSF